MRFLLRYRRRRSPWAWSFLGYAMDAEERREKSAGVRIKSAASTGIPKSASRNTRSTRPALARTAMGEFVVSEGGRPLTAQGRPTPSGLDYRPRTALTLPSSPEYTVKGHLRPLSQPQMPSPSDHHTGRDLVWAHSTISLKRKGVTWPYDTRKDAHITSSPGTAQFKIVYGDTGARPAQPCSQQHKGRIQAGPPNPLVQPCDTEGFQTPGCKYWPRPDTGRKHSFGTQLKKEDGETLGPGPAAYTRKEEAPPTAVIGELLPELQKSQTPASNEYDIPSEMGEGPQKTFGLKHLEYSFTNFPAPTAYNPRRPNSAIPPQMTYRAFPWKADQQPGPSDHSVRPQSVLVRSPDYSCREKCLPVFPDVLLYQEHATLNVPGPGNYEYDREFGENSNPAHSIGLPLPQPPNTNPAPNQYKVSHNQRSNLRKTPAYTMGRKFSGNHPASGMEPRPGPADYCPKTMDKPTACSITPRRKTQTELTTPGANSYSVKEGLTRKGVGGGPAHSLKGRPSPFVYNGFSNSAMYKCSTLV